MLGNLQLNWRSTVFSIFAVLAFVFMGMSEANASHYRYGNISWRVISGRTVELTATTAWRSTFVSSASFSGWTQISNVNVSSVNGVTTKVQKFTRTFSSNGPHVAQWGSCCRIGGLSNSGSNWVLRTVIDLNNGNENSPVSSLPAIVNVQDGLNPATFTIPANDLDGDNLTYRLANSTELAGGAQPPGFSINSSTGVVSVNTSLPNYSPGQLYFAGIVISDGQAEVMVDFLMEITQQSTPPFFNYGPTPANGTVYQLSPGQSVNFQVQAQDNDPGGSISTLFASGLPGGVSFNVSSGNPATSTFSWTPGVSDFGTYVLNFIAQDNIGVQASTSVTLQVSLKPQFDIPPTPATGAHNIVVAPGTLINYTVQASDPDPTDAVRFVAVEGKNMMGNKIPLYPGATFSNLNGTPGNPTSGVFNWQTQPSDWGHRHVFFTAEDNFGDRTTHEVYQLLNTKPGVSSTPVTSVNVGQTYTYNIVSNDPDIQYGDQVDFVAAQPLPSWLSLSTNPVTGTAVLSGTPSLSDAGNYNISLLVEDINHHHQLPSPTHDFTISVVPCNVAISGTASNATCPGASDGSVNLNETGGTAPFIYGRKVFEEAFDGSSAPSSFSAANISTSASANGLQLTAGSGGWASQYLSNQSFSRTPGTTFEGSVFIPYNGYKALMIGFHDGLNNGTSGIAHGIYFFDNGTTAPISVSARNGGAGAANLPTSSYTNSSSPGKWLDFKIEVLANGATYSVKEQSASTYTNSLTQDWGFNPSTLKIGIQATTSSGLQPFTIKDFRVYKGNPATTGLAAGNYTYYINDANGCEESVTVSVDDQDVTNPIAACKNITVQLDDNGTASITAADVNNGSSDNCGIASIDVHPKVFTCANIGNNVVTLTVTDNSGNSSTCTANVLVEDVTDPVAVCNDLTIDLQNRNVYNLTQADVDFIANGTNDNCSVSWSITNGQTAFDCNDRFNDYVVTLTAVDGVGNANSCNATISITDDNSVCNDPPTAVCKNITIYTGSNCDASIVATDVDGGSTDPDGDQLNYVVSSTGPFAVGTHTVTLTVSDAEYSDDCTATITVEDNTPPAAICKDIIIQLDANGAASIVASDIDGGSNDACGIASIAASQTDFDCSHIGDNTVTLTVTDNNGNTSTCNATVTVEDNIAPYFVSCQCDVIRSNDAGQCNANVTMQCPVIVADNCGTGTLVVTNSHTGTNDASGIYPVGVTTVVWTVTDASGNSSNYTQVVMIMDTEKPQVTCTNPITVNVDAGECGADVTVPAPAASDNCGIMWIENNRTGIDNADDFYPVGTTTVRWLVQDVNGNFEYCTSTITVVDNEAPSITCAADITQTADTGSCDAAVSVPAPTVDDNCGVAGYTNDYNNSTDASDTYPVGTTTITWTVTDIYGNSSTCQQTISIEDNEAPKAICQAVTVQLDAAGNGNITAADVNDGSTDNCGIASYSLSQTDFDCSHVGSNTVTLTVTDIHGNSSTCDATITVEDNVAPNAVCKNIIVQLDASGVASISADDIDDGSNDACGIASLSIDKDNFNCSNVGANMVNLTVTDVNGNSSSCAATVTVEDNVAPNAICQDITVKLDANGAASITAAQIDNGSNDACGIASLSVSPSTFDCNNIGDNTVTLTVEDNNGNTSTCTATVTVEDDIAPIITCAADVTVSNDAGDCSAYVSLGQPTMSDNCNITSVMNSYNGTADASGTYPVGTTTVVWTIKDQSDNTTTCSMTVTVEDNEAPNTQCNNITVQLDASGAAGIVVNDIDNNSTDNCGIDTRSIDINSFDCSDVGANTVTLTITDIHGNTSTCQSTVTVEDNIDPIAICKNATVQLDANGQGSITTADIDNGSNDACGIKSFSLDKTDFSCADVGQNTVTLTVEDNNGNISTCQATVTVRDEVKPTAICKNITVQLDASGAASITANDVDDNSWDACGIASLSVSPTTFNCSNVGANTVTLVVIDNNGNMSTCQSTVTIEDNVAPQAICQNVTVQLDANGNGSITANDVDNGSNDACGIASMTVSPNTFDCGDVGANTVTLTVTDNNGNVSTCTATATVEDNVDPVAICKDVTVQLDAAGNGSIVAADIDNGSNDACGIASLTASQTTFDCGDVGNNTITLTVEDNNGNTSTCTATVTVEDNVAPVAECQSITVQLNASGAASITASQIDNGSNDACGIANMTVSPSSFDCSNVGANTVTLTVTDNNGNSSTCTATVTIEDNVAPVAQCQNVTVQLDANGDGSITASQVDNGSSDACGIASMKVSPSTFDCGDVGANTVTLTLTDNNGNVSTCTATVTVEDNVAPVAQCQNVTVALDGNGNASVTASQVDNGSNDACGIANLSLSQTDFDCDDLGTNTVTLTVTDNNGNSSTCTAQVLVQDNTDPVISNMPSNMTVRAERNDCDPVVMWNPPTAADNCTVQSFTSTAHPGDEFPVGTHTVTYTAVDQSNNTTTASFTITVEPDPLVVTSLTAHEYNGRWNISCNGEYDGSAKVIIEGGCLPYTYNWSNGSTTDAISNVPAGTYTIVVTDANGTTISDQITLHEPNVLTATVDKTDIVCHIEAESTCEMDEYTKVKYGGHAVWLPNLPGSPSSKYVFDNKGSFETYADGSARISGTVVNASDPAYSWEVEIWLTGKMDWSNWSAMSRGWKGNSYIVGNNYKNWDYYVMDNARLATLKGKGNYAGKTLYLNHKPSNQYYGFQVGKSANDKDYSYGMSGWFTYTGDYSGHGDVNVDLDDCKGNNKCDCEGRMRNFSVAYSGSDNATIKIVTGSNPSKNCVSLSSITGVDDGDIVTIQGNWKDGRLGPKTWLIINGNTYQIHTSCSEPILGNSYGPFTVVSYTDGDGNYCEVGTGSLGCDGTASLNITGGTAPYTVNWSNGSTGTGVSGICMGTYSVSVTDANGCSWDTEVTINNPEELDLDLDGDNPNCYQGNDGSIDLTVTGGVAPYTYIWSNNATTEDLSNLPAGEYEVIVTDAGGCSISGTVTLKDPKPSLYINACADDVNCYGGSDGEIDLKVYCSNKVASYSWSNNATTADIDNLSAGTYTVTVTDYNGCSLTESFDVEEPDALLVSASSPEYSNGYNVSSHGADDGSIDLDVSGGTPGYSYDWNGSAQKSATLTRNVESRYGDAEEDHRGRMSTGSGDLDLGDYRVGVYFDDIDIPQGAEIVEAYIQFTAAGSDNNTANFTIKGHDVNHSYKFKSKKRDISRRTTTSASVNWQPGAWSRNASGSAQRTSDISSVVQEIVDRGGWRDGYAMSFIITGSGDREAYTYDGSRGRAPKLVIRYKQDVTGNDPEDLPAGYYTVRVTDKNGCAANTSITLTQPNKGSGAVLADKTVMENAENEATTDVELEIGPNPVENFAVVRFTLEKETQALVRVVDMSGKTLQTVYTGNVMAAEQVQVQTDLSQLRSGMYQIIITTTSGKQTVKRFVVAR